MNIVSLTAATGTSIVRSLTQVNHGEINTLAAAIVLLNLASDDTYRVYAMGNWQPPFGIVMVLDRLAAMML